MKLVIAAALTSVSMFAVAPAFAADLLIDEPAYMPGVVDVGGKWDGVFIGAFAGYGWGAFTDDEGLYGPLDASYDIEGWLAGVAVGANFTVSEAIVAGIVADIAWADFAGSDGAIGLSARTDWTGSVRGRLGFDGGVFLPYVTAGLAFANNTITFDDGNNVFEDTNTHIGWMVGAGVEVEVADNVSLDLLYRYSDFGSQTYSLSDVSDFGLTSHAASAGINFKF